MRRNNPGKVGSACLALVTALTLSGCTIPFVNIEVPIELPDLSGLPLPDLSKLPLPDLSNLPLPDLSELDIPKFTLPIGVTTSIDEAISETQRNEPAVSDAALVEPGYLTVGVKTATSMAPLCVLGEGGVIYGMDIDYGAALASEMGLKVRYVTVVDGSALGSDCDVIMNGRTDNPDFIAIAGTYVESATSFFRRGDATVVAPTDLGGKSVGLQGGSISEIVLNATALKMSQQQFANLNEAFDALEAGQVDFVLCEAYPGAYLASIHKNISFAGTIEAPTTSGVAVLASNTELLNAVQVAFERISGNGILDIARSRWVGSMPTLTTDSQIQGIPQAKRAAPPVTEEEPQGESEESEGEGTDDGSDVTTVD